VPVWAWTLLGLALVAIGLPSIRQNNRTQAARRALKAAWRLRGAEREGAEREALALVQDNPQGLVAVADLALGEGRRELAVLAVASLRATRRLPEELLRLTRVLEGAQPRTPLEAAIQVDRLREDGRLDVARERLQLALRRWPQDDDLTEAAAKLENPGAERASLELAPRSRAARDDS
jgi:hypothetical protein